MDIGEEIEIIEITPLEVPEPEPYEVDPIEEPEPIEVPGWAPVPELVPA